MFVLTIFHERLKFSQGNVTILQKMKNYEEARVTLINTRLNKSKFSENKKDWNNINSTKGKLSK